MVLGMIRLHTVAELIINKINLFVEKYQSTKGVVLRDYDFDDVQLFEVQSVYLTSTAVVIGCHVDWRLSV
jgi:hypothetical protein